MNDFPQIDPALMKLLENQRLKDNKELKDIFRNEIKGNFLIDIKSRVEAAIGPVILNFYDFDYSEKAVLTGNDSTVQYELCKMIVGVHHSNTVFLSEAERSQKERDPEYKNQLICQVAMNIALRRYAGAHLRRRNFIKGERFIFYSVPYLLFVMCTRIFELFENEKTLDANGYWARLITNKSLAALTLLEDSFLDSAYMPCRAVIESFMKLMILKGQPQLFDEERRFASYELEKTCVSHRYSDEFNEAFENRKNVSCVNKIDYLHFGFVDAIDDYHDIVRYSPYSLNGIVRYLEEKADNATSGLFDWLKGLYSMCHGYAHGNVTQARFPLLHYFEICLILGEIVPRVYTMVCDSRSVDCRINNIKVMERFDEEFDLLREQYKKRSLEMFELEQAKYKQ